jgi:hypothetical protein
MFCGSVFDKNGIGLARERRAFAESLKLMAYGANLKNRFPDEHYL